MSHGDGGSGNCWFAFFSRCNHASRTSPHNPHTAPHTSPYPAHHPAHLSFHTGTLRPEALDGRTGEFSITVGASVLVLRAGDAEAMEAWVDALSEEYVPPTPTAQGTGKGVAA